MSPPRSFAIFKKGVRQAVRDRISLFLTLSTAPLFAALYGVFFAGKDATRPGQLAPFDAYVPGLLVFAVIMLVFSAAMAVAKEVEQGGLLRLKLTPVTTGELLMGVSAVQLILGTVSLALTLAAAIALGFDAKGNALWVLLLGAIGGLSSIGLGMLVASASRTVQRAFLIASAVMFLLLLFSGVIFPRPDAMLFEVDGRSIGAFDLLPTTHLHAGLSKVLFAAADPADLGFEIASLAVLSIAYFGAGVIAFELRHRLASR